VFDGENLVGTILLIGCAAVAGVLVYSIVTGTTFRYTGPEWLPPVLLVAYVGALVYAFLRGRHRL